MGKHNDIAYRKFDDFLQLNRKIKKYEDGIDIKDKIFSLIYSDVDIAIQKINLESAYASNMKVLFNNLRPLNTKHFGSSKTLIMQGTIQSKPENSHGGAANALQDFDPNQTDLILCEQGFLASTHSWSESFKKKDSISACLGYVYDDISYYFMAEYPNRLNYKLNSDACLNEREAKRVKTLIKKIVDNKVSKYNSQPIIDLNVDPGYTSRVLVCDQSYCDASTVYGLVDDTSFENMLITAIKENPESQILVKTHPDTYWESDKRTGYYNLLESTGRVKIIRDPINPYCLFDIVEKVYVGTSQIGLEALFAGKDVVCFGAPFYAGWGLTDDRIHVPHRCRSRSLEDIFYYFYIWYTIYHLPNINGVTEIENVIDYIIDHRPVSLTNSKEENESPVVSVILPVYNVEDYVGESIKSILDQTLSNIEVIAVNDCSTDNSLLKLDEIRSEDNRLIIVNLESNIGQGYARNKALEIARGEYIFFLDSDDLLYDNNLLETLYKNAQNSGAELVRCQKVIFEDGKTLNTAKLDNIERYFNRDFLLPNALDDSAILKTWHFWNFLYKKDMLIKHNIQFVTTQWEERAFICKALAYTNFIFCSAVKGVAYRKRAGSTVRRERSILDLERMALNIQSSAEWYLGSSNLHVIALQFVNSLLNPSWRNLILSSLEKKKDLDFLKSAFLPYANARVEDLYSTIKDVLGCDHALYLKLEVVFSAITAGKWSDLYKILNDEPFTVEYLHDIYYQVPVDDLASRYQAALNNYVKNDKILVEECVLPSDITLPKIIIHGGSTKTGSTYIQHFLDSNRPALLRNGVLYPEVGLFWQKDRPHKQAGHSEFTYESTQKPKNNKLYRFIVNSIVKARTPIHTIIISSEAYFLNKNSLNIPDYFDAFECKFTCYLRSQDEWANSQYSEFVAGGAVGRVTDDFDTWISQPITKERLDYASFLIRWCEKLGNNNVWPRLYDRNELLNGDVLDDFLSLIDINFKHELIWPDTSVTANIFPFNTAHVYLIKEINNLPWSSSDSYLEFIEAYGKAITRHNEKVSIINRLQASKVMKDVESSNNFVRDEFFPGMSEDAPLFKSKEWPEKITSSIPYEDIKSAYELYHQYAMKGESKPKPKPKAKTVKAQGAKKLEKNKSDVIKSEDKGSRPLNNQVVAFEFDKKISSTYSYATYKFVSSYFLPKNKVEKLVKKPVQYFVDNHTLEGKFFYKLIELEMKVRGV